MRNLLLALFIFSPLFTQAKCIIPRAEIENYSEIVKWQGTNGEEQNTALVEANTVLNIFDSDQDADVDADIEAFIRPDEDGVFQILPLPLFMVEMQKGRDSIYLCAHYDSKVKENTEIVIYFLRYNRIRPIAPKPLPFMGIKNIFKNRFFSRTPFALVTIPATIAEKVQEIAINIFGDLTKFGVDRVRITDSEMQIYSGGDPTQFEHYVFKTVIPLKED